MGRRGHRSGHHELGDRRVRGRSADDDHERRRWPDRRWSGSPTPANAWTDSWPAGRPCSTRRAPSTRRSGSSAGGSARVHNEADTVRSCRCSTTWSWRYGTRKPTQPPSSPGCRPSASRLWRCCPASAISASTRWVRASTRCPARSGPGRRPRRRPAGQHGDHVAARLRRRRRWPAATGDGDRGG
jgi:hypothetical protein